MFNQQIIRRQFIEYKREYKLSFRAITGQTGVCYSSLSRFVQGKSLDIESLVKIAEYLGIENLSGGCECDGNTLSNIREVIEADTGLSAENKDKVWKLFEAMYRSLGEK